MAVETFFSAHCPFALYELEMTTLATHFCLFNRLVGNGFLIRLSFFFLGLQWLSGDLVTECALGPFYIELGILEMTEETFFLGDLEMFLLTLTLMAGSAVEFMPYYPFLLVIMFVMDKWNRAFSLVCSFVLGIVDFLCPVFSLFSCAGCRMTSGSCTTPVVDPGLFPDYGIVHI